jgi:GAF domain-containing protein
VNGSDFLDRSEARIGMDAVYCKLPPHPRMSMKSRRLIQAILANATRLCEAGFASLLLSEGDRFRRVSLYNAPPAFAEHLRRTPMVRPHPESALGRTALTKQVVQINDTKTSPAYLERDPTAVAGAELAGYRTVLAVPMLKENALVGVIVVFRQEIRPFSEKHIDLVSNSRSRPSSPSRTRVCSTNCANLCSSRPPPPMCSR